MISFKCSRQTPKNKAEFRNTLKYEFKVAVNNAVAELSVANVDPFEISKQYDEDKSKKKAAEKEIEDEVYGDEIILPTVIDEERRKLPEHVQERLNKIEYLSRNEIGEALGIPRIARKKFLSTVVQNLTDIFINKDVLSKSDRDAAFEEAYKTAIEVNEAFVEKYKGLKLSDIKINVGNEMSNIVELSDGLLNMHTGEESNINEVYKTLNKQAPKLFPASTTDPIKQIYTMYVVAKALDNSTEMLKDAKSSHYGDQKYIQTHLSLHHIF